MSPKIPTYRLLGAASALALSLSCSEVSRPSAQPVEPVADRPAGSLPFVFPAKHSNGEKAGGLTLGTTTVKQAMDSFAPFPKGMDEGAPRLDAMKVTVAGRALKLLTIYNPWETSYQLHFDANDSTHPGGRCRARAEKQVAE